MNILDDWRKEDTPIRYNPIELGRRFQKAYKENGDSIEDVAARLSHKTHSYLSSIETGKEPIDYFTLEALSLLYHLTPKYLLGIDGRSFASMVETEMLWIKKNRILGNWGTKGAEIQYDMKEFGSRCRKARTKKGYSLEEVATRLSYKTHSYLSAIETGKKAVNPFTLESLSLLYHEMPKYLLGLEEKSKKSAILLADRYIDKCRFLVQNSISDPESFGFPAEQSLDEILDYIKSITKLGCVPVPAARNIVEISMKIPILQRVQSTKNLNRNEFTKGLLPPPYQLMSLRSDCPEYAKVSEAWCDLQDALDNLYENNPEWLALIAQVIAKGPKYFSFLLDFVESGEFTSVAWNDSDPNPKLEE